MKDELTKIAAAMREYAAKVEQMAVESEKPQTPKPPPGYRLATEDERKCLPEGAMLYMGPLYGWDESANWNKQGAKGASYAVPDTFQSHGKTWTRHTPGYPMPCSADAKINILCRSEKTHSPDFVQRGDDCAWEASKSCKELDILAWRYADEKPEPKMVPLGQDDVRCGDEVKHKEVVGTFGITRIYKDGVWACGLNLIGYESLQRHYLIRRRNSYTFEPCEKPEKEEAE